VLRAARVLVFAWLLALLVLPPPAAVAEPWTPVARLWSYEQAYRVGFYPQSVPASTGLPPCPLKPPSDPGFASAEEADAAAAAAEDAPACAMRPRSALYGNSAPLPLPLPQAYRHTGITSKAPFGDSLRAALEIPNPSVPESVAPNFMAGRVLAKTCLECAGHTWIEAGWQKGSFTITAGYGKPCVYSFTGTSYILAVYCTLDLSVGRSYMFKVEDVDDAVESSILWDGMWYVLEVNPQQACRHEVDEQRAVCDWEVLLEPYLASSAAFDIRGDSYGGRGMSFEAISFRTLRSRSWQPWEARWHDAQIHTRAPYVSCPVAGREWREFTVQRATGCGSS
jgi:hypothetical protein